MNISFFQTYGDRLPLLKIRTEDKLFQEFLTCFDLNIISLHNVSDNIRLFVKNDPFYKNFIVFDFVNITYCQCIKNIMGFIEEKKATKFFFYQDDTFSCEVKWTNTHDLESMIFYYDYEMINISYKTGHLIEKGRWTPENKKIIYTSPYFKLFDTNTFDFRDSTLWAFDDSCFVCRYEALKNIFDNNYFNYSDIWQAEIYLKTKFEQNCINRFITDTSFFINYNILGRNTNPKNIDILKNNISLTDETYNLLLQYHKG